MYLFTFAGNVDLKGFYLCSCEVYISSRKYEPRLYNECLKAANTEKTLLHMLNILLRLDIFSLQH